MPTAKKKQQQKKKAAAQPRGLTVAVTGPTGDIGTSLLRALDRTKGVDRVLGMARRPFDPAGAGLKKTEYRQGDVLDRDSVDALVADADVVVHLAFLILGSHEESRRINLEGSRNVFEAVAASKKAKRAVYASSVAAYGFHDDNPELLSEEVPARGTDEHYYSQQKAEVEQVLEEVLGAAGKQVYVFRPCIVAGENALLMIENIPYVQMGDRIPAAVRRLFDVVPVLKPVIPDNGTPFQLVHHDDVAAAMTAAVLGKGEPGVYNLAGAGELTMSDLADALGWYSVPIPDLAVDATAQIVSRLPFMPAEAQWVNVMRVPVLMDTTKAREQLGWKPEHDARETLERMVTGARGADLIR
jgi:nucleoside-diphosphate-sugar epimerase